MKVFGVFRLDLLYMSIFLNKFVSSSTLVQSNQLRSLGISVRHISIMQDATYPNELHVAQKILLRGEVA